jgi:hypothetical protein
MKTAISIDELIYHKAEEAAAELGLTRSRLYTLAVDEYLQNHHPGLITERLNRYYKDRRAEIDEDIQQATYNLFAEEDW